MEEEKEGRGPGSHWKDPGLEGDAPPDFDETFLVLVPIDPHSLHIYWRVAPEDVKGAEARIGSRDQRASVILKFYTQQPEAEATWRVLHELEAAPSGSYTLRGVAPGKRYAADLGFKTQTGDYVSLARSTVVETPRSEPIGGKTKGKAPQKAGTDPTEPTKEAEKKEPEKDLTTASEEAFAPGLSSKNRQ